MLRVADSETIVAMRMIFERMKLVAEPSSAIALAAILKHRDFFAGKRVGVVLTVSDSETIAAMRIVFERMKLVVEPSSAIALAAVIRHREHFAGKRVGMILSGGNVDLDALPW